MTFEKIFKHLLNEKESKLKELQTQLINAYEKEDYSEAEKLVSKINKLMDVQLKKIKEIKKEE